MPDFMFHQEHMSNVCLLTPISDAAREWTNEHIPDTAQWMGPSVAIEVRYADDILEGISDADLTVEAG